MSTFCQIAFELLPEIPLWWWVDIDTANGVVPSGIKSLLDPMLIEIYATTCRQYTKTRDKNMKPNTTSYLFISFVVKCTLDWGCPSFKEWSKVKLLVQYRHISCWLNAHSIRGYICVKNLTWSLRAIVLTRQNAATIPKSIRRLQVSIMVSRVTFSAVCLADYLS